LAEKIADSPDAKNADVACDFYHRYKEDVQLLKTIGVDSFKFSISWSRVLPKGKVSGGVNSQGVKFYNDLINELLSNGIKPLVFLMHNDPPQALEDEYDGPLSTNFVNDFQDYADFCFKTFGDRVKLWATMNEPISISINGYSTSTFPPGRCSSYVPNCTAAGNSATEPYIVGHNLLLAHGAAVKVYKDKYQPYQKGKIGVTTYSTWMEPKYNTSSSREATSRYIDFVFGWFVHPVIFGDYPERIKSVLGNRLPKFTEAQSKLVKGSLDFLGISYYSAGYAENLASANGVNVTFWTDVHAKTTSIHPILCTHDMMDIVDGSEPRPLKKIIDVEGKEIPNPEGPPLGHSPFTNQQYSRGSALHNQGNQSLNRQYNQGPLQQASNFLHGSRASCQICGRTNHLAIDCYHQMNYAFQGKNPPTQLAAMVAHTNFTNEEQQWLTDSRANAPITNQLENLQIQQPFQQTEKVAIGKGTGLQIETLAEL
ncbi:beta-glucosidase 17-like, partial [Corylus avellana]|uniref:beta-glucosidase 17-like n=1 Tax=Corylus avellana TaxID=13451 RepID=UPI00286AE0E7